MRWCYCHVGRGAHRGQRVRRRSPARRGFHSASRHPPGLVGQLHILLSRRSTYCVYCCIYIRWRVASIVHRLLRAELGLCGGARFATGSDFSLRGRPHWGRSPRRLHGHVPLAAAVPSPGPFGPRRAPPWCVAGHGMGSQDFREYDGPKPEGGPCLYEAHARLFEDRMRSCVHLCAQKYPSSNHRRLVCPIMPIPLHNPAPAGRLGVR